MQCERFSVRGGAVWEYQLVWEVVQWKGEQSNAKERSEVTHSIQPPPPPPARPAYHRGEKDEKEEEKEEIVQLLL